ncbi:MAG: exosortase F system-associated protein [Cyclobacteriaceae bacterium]|nr:exosortase F system-associated protein [Cyclobacteriaceae bacterium]
MPTDTFTRRHAVIAAALIGLFLVYMFQRVDILGILASWMGQSPPSATASFIVNRASRLIINDLLCLMLVSTIFNDKRFTRLALWVFLGELFLLLPIYLVVKLSAEGPTEISSPVFQPLHRMIVNPLLMIILIAGMYYQRRRESNP